MVQGAVRGLLQHLTTDTSPRKLAAHGWGDAHTAIGADASSIQRAVDMVTLCAQWSVQPPHMWLAELLEVSAAHASLASGPQLSMLLRGCALLAQAPLPDSAQAPLSHILRALLPQLPHCSPTAAVEVAWSLVCLHPQNSSGSSSGMSAAALHEEVHGCVSPAWWATYEAHMVSRMRSGQLLPSALAELLWSMGALGWRPGRAFMEVFAHAAAAALPRFCPDDLARLVWALAAVREEAPAVVWMDRFFAVSSVHLASCAFSAHNLALLAGGLAVLRARPADWLTRFADQVVARLPECRAVHLAKILSSLASLAYTPSEAFLQRFTAAAAALVPELTPHAAAELAWGMARCDQSMGHVHVHALAGRFAASGLHGAATIAAVPGQGGTRAVPAGTSNTQNAPHTAAVVAAGVRGGGHAWAHAREEPPSSLSSSSSSRGQGWGGQLGSGDERSALHSPVGATVHSAKQASGTGSHGHASEDRAATSTSSHHSQRPLRLSVERKPQQKVGRLGRGRTQQGARARLVTRRTLKRAA